MSLNALQRLGRVLLMTAVVTVCGAGAARADLIVNGSFESPNVGGNYVLETNGSVPGWTSNNNEIEVDTTSILGLANYNGTQSVELNGTAFDTISQTVTGLVVGQNYTLGWAYSGRSGSGAQQMNVLFNNVQVGQNTDSGTGPFAWATTSVIVQATATSEVLSFAAINVGGNNSVGNELDGVTLTAVASVPEPASIGVMLVALAGLLVWRHRRVRRSA